MTATNYKGIARYLKRKSRATARFRRKGAILWCGVLVIAGVFAINGIYQIIRKPSEIFAPVSASFAKSPETTWQSYGPLFEEHATSFIAPEFLAALAQVESDGNPIARTYWRWRLSWNLFEIYRPASSAVGMFQFIDGTFAEARKYCIHNHRVAVAGPWYDFHSCWFNSLYTRNIPSHSIEMTAAYLHQGVLNTLGRRSISQVTAAQKQRLAAVLHLCGKKRAEAFARRNFRATAGERCGSHSVSGYLMKIDRMKKGFEALKRGAELAQIKSRPPVFLSLQDHNLPA